MVNHSEQNVEPYQIEEFQRKIRTTWRKVGFPNFFHVVQEILMSLHQKSRFDITRPMFLHRFVGNQPCKKKFFPGRKNKRPRREKQKLPESDFNFDGGTFGTEEVLNYPWLSYFHNTPHGYLYTFNIILNLTPHFLIE